MSFLPDFKLETYFSKWEFNTKFNLCASDTESLDLKYLLSICSKDEKKLWDDMRLGYTETFGSDILIDSISKTYDNVDKKDILTFAGAEEGIYISMNSILSSDDHCIVITPNYQSAQTIPSSICDVTNVDLDSKNNWNMDLDILRDSIKPNTKLISINFPHNPTGKIISQDELNQLVDICRDKGIYLFSDEIYRLMERDKTSRLTQISDIYERGISLNGMSKSYGMPGVRIGWISTKDHKLILDKAELKRYNIGIGKISSLESMDPEYVEAVDATIRIRQSSGAYNLENIGLKLIDDTLFSANIALPSNLREGDYEAFIYLVQNKKVSSVSKDVIKVRKIGLEKVLYNTAHDHPLFYGFFSIFLALISGWVASAVFRRFQQ